MNPEDVDQRFRSITARLTLLIFEVKSVFEPYNLNNYETRHYRISQMVSMVSMTSSPLIIRETRLFTFRPSFWMRPYFVMARPKLVFSETKQSEFKKNHCADTIFHSRAREYSRECAFPLMIVSMARYRLFWGG